MARVLTATTGEMDERSDQEAEVFRWRVREFRRMGFDEVRAEQLADTPDADLHDVEHALDRGWTHEAAFRAFA